MKEKRESPPARPFLFSPARSLFFFLLKSKVPRRGMNFNLLARYDGPTIIPDSGNTALRSWLSPPLKVARRVGISERISSPVLSASRFSFFFSHSKSNKSASKYSPPSLTLAALPSSPSSPAFPGAGKLVRCNAARFRSATQRSLAIAVSTFFFFSKTKLSFDSGGGRVCAFAGTSNKLDNRSAMLCIRVRRCVCERCRRRLTCVVDSSL